MEEQPQSEGVPTALHADVGMHEGKHACDNYSFNCDGLLAVLTEFCARFAEVGGFVPYQDQGDAYKLVYPFGWQVR